MKSADFLDLLRQHYGAPSDRKLAARIGWTRERISAYRTGRREFDEQSCADVARRLNLSPAYVMAEIAAERADCTEVRDAWTTVARMLKTVRTDPKRLVYALLAGLVLAQGMVPSPAVVAATALQGILRKITRGRGFARLWRPYRRSGAQCRHPNAYPIPVSYRGTCIWRCPDCGRYFMARPGAARRFALALAGAGMMSGHTVKRLAAHRGRAWDSRPMNPPSSPTWLLAFVILLPLMAAGGCSVFERMPATERAWQTLHLVDVAQTLNGPATDPCYFEVRSVRHLIGEKPEPAAVLAWGAAAALVHYAGSRLLDRAELPRGLELAMRTVDLGYKGLTIGQNLERGVRPFGGNDCPWR